MTRERAKVLYEHYSAYEKELMQAQLALVKGGVKSYTIGDRTLTRFDIRSLKKELEDISKLLDQLEAIMNGKPVRAFVGIVTTDF